MFFFLLLVLHPNNTRIILHLHLIKITIIAIVTVFIIFVNICETYECYPSNSLKNLTYDY